MKLLTAALAIFICTLLFLPVPSSALVAPDRGTPQEVELTPDIYLGASVVSTSVRMVQECQIVDHLGCVAPAQQGENCAPEGFPEGLCHCIVTPQRLCVTTP